METRPDRLQGLGLSLQFVRCYDDTIIQHYLYDLNLDSTP